jgi:monofunctional biosynthetic peptidoglycan transglycosylase
MKKPRWRQGLLKWLAIALLSLMLLSVLMVAGLRRLNPPTSAFMLQHLADQWLGDSGKLQLYHRWEAWRQIAPDVPLAVVAAEDQRFPAHHGFDLTEIGNALEDWFDGERLRGASTLSQQLAKNLFLWSDQNLLRKALEVWFTGLIELLLPKQRILELYLNLAQFGPHTFGVAMAAERFFNKPAARLTRKDASLLAAVLPAPSRYTLRPPLAKVKKRAAWIRRQMNNLGNNYLHTL